MKPTIGRLVHYVLSVRDTACKEAVGKHRPAIIVNDLGNGAHEPTNSSSALNLQVFTDGAYDGMAPTHWAISATYDETGETPGSWHWPERS